MLDSHDWSKLSLVEMVGYTEKFFLTECNDECWNAALKHHYEHNKHHPQHCEGTDMDEKDFQESMVDAMACVLVKKMSADQGSKLSLLLHMNSQKELSFNGRYTKNDEKKANDMLKKMLRHYMMEESDIQSTLSIEQELKLTLDEKLQRIWFGDIGPSTSFSDRFVLELLQKNRSNLKKVDLSVLTPQKRKIIEEAFLNWPAEKLNLISAPSTWFVFLKKVRQDVLYSIKYPVKHELKDEEYIYAELPTRLVWSRKVWDEKLCLHNFFHDDDKKGIYLALSWGEFQHFLNVQILRGDTSALDKDPPKENDPEMNYDFLDLFMPLRLSNFDSTLEYARCKTMDFGDDPTLQEIAVIVQMDDKLEKHDVMLVDKKESFDETPIGFACNSALFDSILRESCFKFAIVKFEKK